MKKLMIITFGILLLASMLSAQPRVEAKDDNNMKPGMGMHRMQGNQMLCEEMQGGEMHQMMCEKLDLTKEQQKKFETLATAHKKQMNTFKAEVENLQIDLKAALKTQNFKQAKDLNKQISDKKLMMANARIDHMEAMFKELTPEQKDKAADMFMMMGAGHGKGMKGRGPGRGMGMGMHQGGMQHCK